VKSFAWVVTSVLAISVLAGCGRPVSTVSVDREASVWAKATGTKHAFLVGINQYQLPGNNLRGCVNDIQDAQSKMLVPQGFKDIKVLTDKQATRANILAGLSSMVKSAQPGDFLYFHYSGHGAQVDDTNGDEPDGQDEILCPTDLKVVNGTFQNAVVDDEIQTILGQLKPGVGFLMVSDSCHSGSIDQLSQSFSATQPRAFNMPAHLANATPLQANKTLMSAYQNRVRGGQYVVITGCQDDQTSADAYINGRYNGALTYYLLDTFTKGGASQTYGQWHKSILAGLSQGGYDQRPVLVGNASAKIFSIQ